MHPLAPRVRSYGTPISFVEVWTMSAVTGEVQQDTSVATQSLNPAASNQAVPTSARAGSLNVDPIQNLISAIQNVDSMSAGANPALSSGAQSLMTSNLGQNPTATTKTTGVAMSAQTVPHPLYTGHSSAGIVQDLMSAVQVVDSMENNGSPTDSAVTQSTARGVPQESMIVQTSSWSISTEGSEMTQRSTGVSHQQPTHLATTTTPISSANTGLSQKSTPTIQSQGSSSSQVSGGANHSKTMSPSTGDAVPRPGISLIYLTSLVLLTL